MAVSYIHIFIYELYVGRKQVCIYLLNIYAEWWAKFKSIFKISYRFIRHQNEILILI